MVYPHNFEHKIGFDKVRELLTKKCLSTLGQEQVEQLVFSQNYDFIHKALTQTKEFVRIIQEEEAFPDQYFFDVRPSLKRIRVEGLFLNEQELFDLKRSLETIFLIVKFLYETSENDGEQPKYPYLREEIKQVAVFPKLIKQIDLIIDKYGKIKDNASATLLNIRRELANTLGGISKSLNSILRKAQADGIVEKDVTPTLRDGRLVIPVLPSHKRKIKGIVHDESASGKTVFIEPSVVVEANNRIRELENDEKREINRILADLSSRIRPVVPHILTSYDFLAYIDFVRAKALLAIQVKAIQPTLLAKEYIEWKSAVHPILQLSLQKHNREVVPLDITLDSKDRILLISGPNAGGKSVCLKTVGLLQFMLQCGLLVPVSEESSFGIFKNILIDIGDEQSIEDDLSTYSSHLTNMKNMVKNSDRHTLLLIDEFGGGTEPQIGGAIAQSLLKRFNDNKAFGVITTHYQNLKLFAEDTPGIINGAMLYDRHLMRPLFQLQIGNPGSSFAVEIARKIGLPEEIIEEASTLVGAEYINADKYLQDIVRDKRYWENKRRNIRAREREFEEKIAKYNTALEDIAQSRKKMIEQAKEEARKIFEESNAKIENTIRTIKEAQAEKEKTRIARKELSLFKEKIENKESSFDHKIEQKIAKIQRRQQRKEQKKKETTHKPEAKGNVVKTKQIEIGSKVTLKGQSTVGEVISIDGKDAVVIFGQLKTKAKLNKLELSNKAIQKSDTTHSISLQTHDAIYDKKLNFKKDIDVRGMRGDEALQAVTYFIDDAIILGMDRVRILHGTGTGILRSLIREYLSTNSGVQNFQDEHVQFGGAGITVIDLY